MTPGSLHAKASPMTRVSVAFAFACALSLLAAGAHAQTPGQPSPPASSPTSPPAVAPSPPAPAPVDPGKALVGAWELSNSDRDMTCMVTFRPTPMRAGSGFAVEWDKGCGGVFPITKEVTSWTLGKNDAIQFLDAKGRILLELTEVETGLYEGLRPGDPLYFLQNQASLGTERTAQDMAGEWAIVRSARPICLVTLSNEAAAPDLLALALKPGCDPVVTTFAPRAWRMDRGQLVIQSARGETWRFEENEADAWQRIPAGRQPLSLVRQ